MGYSGSAPLGWATPEDRVKLWEWFGRQCLVAFNEIVNKEMEDEKKLQPIRMLCELSLRIE